MSEFQESWIQYLLIKEAVRSGKPPHLIFEWRRSDLALVHKRIKYNVPSEWSSPEILALVELKQAMSVGKPDKTALRFLTADVLKLSKIAGPAKHYVVWLLCGRDQQEIDRWLASYEQQCTICQTRVCDFATIELNENINQDKILVPCMLQVAAESIQTA